MKPLLLLLILQHRKSPNIPRLFMLLQKKKKITCSLGTNILSDSKSVKFMFLSIQVVLSLPMVGVM